MKFYKKKMFIFLQKELQKNYFISFQSKIILVIIKLSRFNTKIFSNLHVIIKQIFVKGSFNFVFIYQMTPINLN